MPPLDASLFLAAIRALVRVLAAASVLAVAILWGRRLSGALGTRALSGADRLLVDLGVGIGLLSAVLRTLGFAGAFRPLVAWGVVAAGAFLLAPRGETGAPLSPGERPTGLPPLALAFAVALVPLPLALAPAVSFDALTYHLRTPERALATGTWATDPFNTPTSFPSAHGTLYALALSGDPEGGAAQLLSLALHVAALAALARIASALAGRSAGLVAALLYASVPAAGIVAGFAWADAPLVFSLAASGLALALGAPPAALALAGLAGAVKYTGLLYAAPVGLAALVALRREGALRRAWAGIAAAAAFAAPWYAANAWEHGNPFHPLATRVFGGSGYDETRLARWDAGSAATPLPGWLATFWRPSTMDADLGGPLLLLLFAAGVAVALRKPSTRRAALLVLVPGLLLAGTRPAARVLLPFVAGLAVVAAAALVPAVEARPRLRWMGLAALAILALRGATLIAAHASVYFHPLPVVAGLEPEEAYVRRNFPLAALYRDAAALPEESLVLSVGEPRLFRFPRAAWSGTWKDDLRPLRALFGPDGEGGGIPSRPWPRFTHLLVTDDARRLAQAREPELARRLDRLLERSALVARQDRASLFALPASPGPAGPERAGSTPQPPGPR